MKRLFRGRREAKRSNFGQQLEAQPFHVPTQHTVYTAGAIPIQAAVNLHQVPDNGVDAPSTFMCISMHDDGLLSGCISKLTSLMLELFNELSGHNLGFSKDGRIAIEGVTVVAGEIRTYLAHVCSVILIVLTAYTDTLLTIWHKDALSNPWAKLRHSSGEAYHYVYYRRESYRSRGQFIDQIILQVLTQLRFLQSSSLPKLDQRYVTGLPNHST